MYPNDDYSQNPNQDQNSTDFPNNSANNFSNFNNQTMPENTTNNNPNNTDNLNQDVQNASQTTKKTDSKTSHKTQATSKKLSLLIQAIQTKKGLYSRIKSAFIQRLSKNIDEGKSTASLDMDKFVVELIEEGLRKG